MFNSKIFLYSIFCTPFFLSRFECRFPSQWFFQHFQIRTCHPRETKHPCESQILPFFIAKCSRAFKYFYFAKASTLFTLEYVCLHVITFMLEKVCCMIIYHMNPLKCINLHSKKNCRRRDLCLFTFQVKSSSFHFLSLTRSI